MAPTKGVLLAHSDFPLYAVRALDERHFLVAGGGGQAKTGIANAIEIYELKSSQGNITCSSISRHETGIRAVMNCASHYDGRHHHLATGEDEFCCTYSVKYKVISPETEVAEAHDGVKQRKNENSQVGKDSSDHGVNSSTKQLTFHVEETGKVVSDFTNDGGFQKCVRFSPLMTHLVTGGADGHLRLWRYPELEKVWEVQAHKNEIDDLDFSPDGSKIITVSRDKNGVIWKAIDGQKLSELIWNQIVPEPYRFKSCRYGLIEGKKDKFNFYTINIPVTRSDRLPCYVSMWDSSKFILKKTAKVGTEVVSAFAVSDEGIYLGIGSISGSVSVYVSFSLQKLYYLKEAHSIFVTSVEFLPCSEATKAITGNQDFNLLSVSADNTIRLHQCPERSTMHPIWLIICLVIVLYAVFYLMSEMGL
ncbi:prolactin regulatory element-binding protein-like [Physella acuta]|uniref:prolactin regulatory element-binding protein-like n=1 Tax=Physella acuta TaxID=109671 RepID=UPI0027DAEBC6|nr:prolactin regulatory element-binding protein-like [Physella acuta]